MKVALWPNIFGVPSILELPTQSVQQSCLLFLHTGAWSHLETNLLDFHGFSPKFHATSKHVESREGHSKGAHPVWFSKCIGGTPKSQALVELVQCFHVLLYILSKHEPRWRKFDLNYKARGTVVKSILSASISLSYLAADKCNWPHQEHISLQSWTWWFCWYPTFRPIHPRPLRKALWIPPIPENSSKPCRS